MSTPSLRHTTLDLLELARTVSGYPVVVEADNSLTTTAALRMARGSVPVHTILYHPDLVGEPDYYVAVQCGQVLRFFAPPPSERMDLAFTPQGLAAVLELVQRDGVGQLPGISPEIVDGFAAQIYHGLMRQVRTIPVELRVEEWILESYPEFAEVQRAAVLRQLEENARVLSPSIRSRSPARVFKANVAMNAAVAQFWAGTYVMPELAKPYARDGFAGDGANLLSTWRKASSEATNDREIIDSWAHTLKIRGWYDWVPYVAPA